MHIANKKVIWLLHLRWSWIRFSIKFNVCSFLFHHEFHFLVSYLSYTCIYVPNDCNIRVIFMFYVCKFVIVQYRSKCHFAHSLLKKSPYSELFLLAFFPHFLAFGLNTERYSVSLRIHSECEKMRKNADQNNSECVTFYAVIDLLFG